MLYRNFIVTLNDYGDIFSCQRPRVQILFFQVLVQQIHDIYFKIIAILISTFELNIKSQFVNVRVSLVEVSDEVYDFSQRYQRILRVKETRSIPRVLTFWRSNLID